MPDNLKRRMLLRLAHRLSERPSMPVQCLSRLQLAEEVWSDLLKARRLMQLADARGWRGAVNELRAQLRCSVTSLTWQVQEWQRELEAGDNTARTATVHEIYQDLVALETEFADVTPDFVEHRLSVVTKPVVLEGIDLGRFRIALYFDRLHSFRPYDVIALDPNPAESESDVTHPHVKENDLCEGEGKAPIHKALAERRILDFFVLVQQVLFTYNPANAYVSLESWHGADCESCGALVSDDDWASCDRCNSQSCWDCISLCVHCGLHCCGDCQTACNGCRKSVCLDCRSHCFDCMREFCPKCLPNERCAACEKARAAVKAAAGVTAVSTAKAADSVTPRTPARRRTPSNGSGTARRRRNSRLARQPAQAAVP